jgi:hypothetical protein
VAGAKAVEDYEKQRKNAAERVTATASATATAAATAVMSGQKSGMSNEQLAHEVLLNPLFTLDDKNSKTDGKLVLTKIRESVDAGVWKAMFTDLSSTPQTYAHVFTVLEEVRTSIQVCVCVCICYIYVVYFCVYVCMYVCTHV